MTNLNVNINAYMFVQTKYLLGSFIFKNAVLLQCFCKESQGEKAQIQEYPSSSSLQTPIRSSLQAPTLSKKPYREIQLMPTM